MDLKADAPTGPTRVGRCWRLPARHPALLLLSRLALLYLTTPNLVDVQGYVSHGHEVLRRFVIGLRILLVRDWNSVSHEGHRLCETSRETRVRDWRKAFTLSFFA